MTLIGRLRGASLSWNSTQISPAELEARVAGCAAWLTAQGVMPGDRVALDLAGGLPFVVALLATLRLGVTTAPVDAQLKEAERRALLADLQPRLVITQLPVRLGEGWGEGCVASEAPPLILYTSGSTGRPKGAVLSHAALAFAIESWAGPVMGLTARDVVLQVLPLAHSYGLCAGLLAPLLVGAQVVMHSRFVAAAVVEDLHQKRVSVFPGVSTMFTRLLTEPECSRDKLASLRLVVAGAAPCADALCAAWQQRTGTRILRGYGMTELFRPISHFFDAQTDEPGVVGQPVPGVRVRVVDDAGQDLPSGELGELVIYSPAAMDRYLNAPQDTAAVLRDGWFWTGDLATVDESNGVRIQGRKRERILRGGYSVFPSEVEGVLLGHPAVREVAAMGQPDAELGEEVVAFVVLNDCRAVTADELVEYCRERLAAFKYPRRVVLLTDLPRTSSGKVVKSQLRLAPAL